MYIVAEITRLEPISDYYVPTEHPFVVSFKNWYGDANGDIASFWSSTFGVTEPLTKRTFITGVVYKNSVNYSNKNTLADCLSDDESYFWDNGSQTLYIHYGFLHQIDYVTPNFAEGVSIGLTNDRMRYFDGRPFYPFLLSFPLVEESVDKINYNKMLFLVSKVTMSNKNGFFNQFKDNPIYGNKFSIKTGEEGDLYGDLIERATYYIDDYTFSADDFVLAIQDIKKTLTAQIPNKILNVTDYPNVGDSSIGETIPFGYGNLHDAKGLCINEKAVTLSVDPVFIFLEELGSTSLSDITVWVKNSDDAWVEDTNISVNASGEVTVPSARTGTSPDFNVLPVKADIKGISNIYASDIIKDMNSRFLGVNYDSSNYDTTEWESEETYLKPVSLYMDTTKDLYEWIKELQSLSSVGFRYTMTYNNKRTIRIDNPNRSISLSVPAVDVMNIPSIVAESNKDNVFNKVYIGYNKSIESNTAPRVEDTDYFDESFAKYRIERVYNKISGMELEIDADNRAKIQAEDYYEIHKVFEMELIGEKYLDIRLYDVIEVELSLMYIDFIVNDVWISVLSNGDIKKDSISDSTVNAALSHINSIVKGDPYFGTVRGQVISKKPNYELKTNTIKLRQKSYSLVWEGIYG